jgi:hypothetical protein
MMIFLSSVETMDVYYEDETIIYELDQAFRVSLFLSDDDPGVIYTT